VLDNRANLAERNIKVYGPGAAGNASPIRTITGIQVGDGNLMNIAVDLSDRLYLSEGLPGIISIYAPFAYGQAPRTGVGGSLDEPGGMDFDGSNNLYVANSGNVLVFDLTTGGTAPFGR
jgi:hypothetical protein